MNFDNLPNILAECPICYNNTIIYSGIYKCEHHICSSCGLSWTKNCCMCRADGNFYVPPVELDIGDNDDDTVNYNDLYDSSNDIRNYPDGLEHFCGLTREEQHIYMLHNNIPYRQSTNEQQQTYLTEINPIV